MKIIYMLNNEDVKKILADHFETTEDDVEILDKETRLPVNIEITATEVQE